MSEVREVEDSIIFINYRRTDAGWPADLLRSELGRGFGETLVFLDVRGIDAGDDFEAVLESQLRRTTVLIVLIGNNWLQIHDRFGRRRLDQEHDWVRREIRTALQNPGCTVIPLLIDDAELPDERQALPEDIATLLTRQRCYLRQAHSDDDIEALSRVIEKAGFRRLSSSPGPLSGQQFSDREVSSIVLRLQRLHVERHSEFLGRRELFGELDLLFNRKTFRFEALRGCPEQRWADRLDSGYQTLRVLEGYLRNVKQVAEDEYPIYRELVREVDLYCMQMGALLFDPSVDYNRIEDHIGKTTFKKQLPKGILFPPGVDKQPEIPDVINDQIERHRLRAVDLMDQLQNPKSAAGPRSEPTIVVPSELRTGAELTPVQSNDLITGPLTISAVLKGPERQVVSDAYPTGDNGVHFVFSIFNGNAFDFLVNELDVDVLAYAPLNLDHLAHGVGATAVRRFFRATIRPESGSYVASYVGHKGEFVSIPPGKSEGFDVEISTRTEGLYDIRLRVRGGSAGKGFDVPFDSTKRRVAFFDRGAGYRVDRGGGRMLTYEEYSLEMKSWGLSNY